MSKPNEFRPENVAAARALLRRMDRVIDARRAARNAQDRDRRTTR